MANLIGDHEAYLQEICSKNKLLSEGKSDKKVFYAFGEDEAISSTDKAISPYVKHVMFAGVGKQESLWLYTSFIQVLVNVKTTGTSNGIQKAIADARNLAHKIITQLDARIQKDFDEGDRCFYMNKLLDPQIQPIGPEDQTAYGWEYTISFSTDRDEYNESDWLT
ncbi:hypothetical protein QEG73_21875 [Chitinophagaceae bacterium 26-R-25]|nr:hypothetical protein [Chitinophagaceae bacterium 26-R-25]